MSPPATHSFLSFFSPGFELVMYVCVCVCLFVVFLITNITIIITVAGTINVFIVTIIFITII